MPQFGAPLWVVLSPPHCPDKKQLIDVKDFFKYTEEAGQSAVRASREKKALPTDIHAY